MKFKCTTCSLLKPIPEMYVMYPTGTGKCGKCHLAHQRYYYMRKQIKLRPDKYLSCNDCDQSFKKFERIKRTKVIRDKCSKCGSKNIEACA